MVLHLRPEKLGVVLMPKHELLAHEVAEASRAGSNSARFVSSEHTDFLVQVARQLERLQVKRRRLRRDLRAVEDEIKARRRELKAAAQAIGRNKDTEEL